MKQRLWARLAWVLVLSAGIVVGEDLAGDGGGEGRGRGGDGGGAGPAAALGGPVELQLVSPPERLLPHLPRYGSAVVGASPAHGAFRWPCVEAEWAGYGRDAAPRGCDACAMPAEAEPWPRQVTFVRSTGASFLAEGLLVLEGGVLVAPEDYANALLNELHLLHRVELTRSAWVPEGAGWAADALAPGSASARTYSPEVRLRAERLDMVSLWSLWEGLKAARPPRAQYGAADTAFYDEVNLLRPALDACARGNGTAAATKIDGAAVAFERIFAVNYFHFIAQSLPALVALADAAVLDAEERPVAVLVRSAVPGRPFVRDAIEAALRGEIAAGRVVLREVSPCEVVTADRLYWPTGAGLTPTAASAAALVARILPAPPPAEAAAAGYVLVVDRGPGGADGRPRAREVRNHAALVDALRRSLRAEVRSVRLSGLRVPAQAALFRGAAAVVGVSGAGLANAIFMARGAALVEIVPGAHDFGNGLAEEGATTTCGYTYFYHLCSLVGVRHRALVVASAAWADPLDAPVERVVRMVEQALSEGGAPPG